MRFQNLPLPDLSNKIGETPWMNQDTILNKHMAPKGKLGLVIIKEGSCDFVWEDSPLDIITGNKDNPIIIEPERYHHVIITGKVELKIEFYKDTDNNQFDEKAIRPGEDFVE